MVKNTWNRRVFSSGWLVNPIRINSVFKDWLSSVISTFSVDKGIVEIRFEIIMSIIFPSKFFFFFIKDRALPYFLWETGTHTCMRHSLLWNVSFYDLDSETQISQEYFGNSREDAYNGKGLSLRTYEEYYTYQCVCMCAQLCLTLCDPIHCRL